MAFSEIKDCSHKCLETDEKHANVSEVMSAFKRLRVNESQYTNSNQSKYTNSFQHKYCESQFGAHVSHANGGYRRRNHHLNSVNRDKFYKSKRFHSVLNEENNFNFGAESKNAIQDFSELNPILFKQNQSMDIKERDIKSFNSYRIDSSNFSECAKLTNKVTKLNNCEEKSCAQQALRDNSRADICGDASVDELAAYFADNLYLPRKMSFMAEMMYT